MLGMPQPIHLPCSVTVFWSCKLSSLQLQAAAANGGEGSPDVDRHGDGGDDPGHHDPRKIAKIMKWMHDRGMVDPPGMAWIAHAPAPTTDACNMFSPTCIHS